MDLIITLVLLYLAYRFFYKGKVLDRGRHPDPPHQDPPVKNNRSHGTDDEGEYTDYEEVK
jgi:hypothetical protein